MLSNGALLLCPCLFCPSDNMWCSRRADVLRCAYFSTVITPSWITQQISAEKCMHRGASVHRERQTMFKIVPWKKQTWTKHHNTDFMFSGITPATNQELLTQHGTRNSFCKFFIYLFLFILSGAKGRADSFEVF